MEAREEIISLINADLDKLTLGEIGNVYKFIRWEISEIPGDEKRLWTKSRHK